ncbi:hypothetical protein [Amycolatopsis sp.]|uniref:hypothetical protein n=1 Tax=Amycolatopsis sp. TaxID=37632 RepID=UPI002D7E1D89|nr:hypothetical protein [Amycolatopsis sp.]HET6704443.1 hypothetical protein [Amycolatopsis sp.]
MKKTGFLVAAALAATGLLATPAGVATAAGACIPESVRLTGSGGTSLCLAVPTPSITPPFTAFQEQNGTSNAWCLYTAPNYGGVSFRLPPFSSAGVAATFASGRPC